MRVQRLDEHAAGSVTMDNQTAGQPEPDILLANVPSSTLGPAWTFLLPAPALLPSRCHTRFLAAAASTGEHSTFLYRTRCAHALLRMQPRSMPTVGSFSRVRYRC